MTLRSGIVNLDRSLNAGFIVVASSHVFLAPYTKVEESFSIQAVHDILAFGVWPESLSKFDHNVFPGAVPRSFIGPLVLAIFTYPFLLILKILGLIRSSADTALYIRMILAMINAFSILHFSNKHLPSKDDQLQRRIFILVSMLQFHSLFWAGRTTPNGIVSPIVNIALALALPKKRHRSRSELLLGLALLTSSAVIARIELIGILIPLVFCSLFHSRYFLRNCLLIATAGVSVALISILLTISIDTYFWGRRFNLWNPLHHSADEVRGILWPELEAVLFNVVDGKSSDWGTSPWHAYFSSHLLKILSFSTPLAALGVAQEIFSPTYKFTTLVVIVVHTAIMSFIGHKETRFILYLTPLLNLFTARTTLVLWHEKRYRKVARAIVVAFFSGTAFVTLISLRASVGNYPGGEAMRYLHQRNSATNGEPTSVECEQVEQTLIYPQFGVATVHIDVLPAMTGVNLFQSVHLPRPNRAFGVSQLPSVLTNSDSDLQWHYDKDESLNHSILEQWKSFHYILSEDLECHLPHFFEKESERQFVEFAGISIKRPRQWIMSLQQAPSACLSSGLLSWSCFDSFVPLHFKWREAVWLCKYYDDAIIQTNVKQYNHTTTVHHNGIQQ